MLRLFPSLLPKEMLESFTLPVSEEYFRDYVEPEGDDYAFAVSCLLPLLLADRTRLKSRRRDLEEKRATEDLEAVEENEELQSETAGHPQTQHGASHSRKESELKRIELTALVDTAIMKAMLICPDSGALLQFVRNENCVNLEEGERSLKPAGNSLFWNLFLNCVSGRYFELSALYQSHGLHDIGLETLRMLSLEPEKLEYPPRGAGSDLRGVTGVWAAVQYLSKLTGVYNHCCIDFEINVVDDIDVIRKHSGWVLKQDPEAALEVFVGAQERLPPSIVLPILAEHAPQFSAVCAVAFFHHKVTSLGLLGSSVGQRRCRKE